MRGRLAVVWYALTVATGLRNKLMSAWQVLIGKDRLVRQTCPCCLGSGRLHGGPCKMCHRSSGWAFYRPPESYVVPSPGKIAGVYDQGSGTWQFDFWPDFEQQEGPTLQFIEPVVPPTFENDKKLMVCVWGGQLEDGKATVHTHTQIEEGLPPSPYIPTKEKKDDY